MGAVCSAGLSNIVSEELADGFKYHERVKKIKTSGKETKSTLSSSDAKVYETVRPKGDSGSLPLSFSGELKPSPPQRIGSSKLPQMSTILGRAGTVGLEVLDTLGSSMSNFNASTGFVSGIASRKNKISILAFEVANTIVKGANLLQSLSKENIQFLKNEILLSDGVQQLVSTDMEELLSIAAADKRWEWDVFSGEVFRFGNLCKDPQWHNLNRCFQKPDPDTTNHRQIKEEVEMTMEELATLALNTAELYHELHALDRFEQDYRQKMEELESLHLTEGGENLVILQSELKHQRKLVRSLEKKSLWSKKLEEVMGKLVDIVTFVHEEIMEAFGNDGTALIIKDPIHKSEKLGPSGLALHYASIISQIESIVSRRNSLPPNARDTLYHGLPPAVKAVLRSRLESFQAKEELTISQIKDEMDKTLRWLLPVAANTTNYEFKKTSAPNTLLRLQTLYHADREKTELYILELVTLLHRLISQVRSRDYRFKPLFPVGSSTHNARFLRSVTQRGSLPVHNNGHINSKALFLRPETRQSSILVHNNGKINGEANREALLLQPETCQSSLPLHGNGKNNGEALVLQPKSPESSSTVNNDGKSDSKVLLQLLQPETCQSSLPLHGNGKINGEILVLQPKSPESSSAVNNDGKIDSKALLQLSQPETQKYLSLLRNDSETNNINTSILQPENQLDSSPLTSSCETSKVLKFSQEDRDMLEKVKWRRLVPRSKSQEFGADMKKVKQVLRLPRSTGSSPASLMHLKTLTVP